MSHSGFGFWTLREDTLLYSCDIWTPEEIAEMSINVTEFHTMHMGQVTLKCRCPETEYFLEFSDNTAAEAVADSCVSNKPGMQEVIMMRDEFQRQHEIFSMSERVPTKANVWADMLSRGDEQLVLAEATELQLKIEKLTVPPEARADVLNQCMHRVGNGVGMLRRA